MKKFLTAILSVVLLFSLVACGNSKPADMTDEVYDLGIRALNAADDYIDNKPTADYASAIISDCSSKLETLTGHIAAPRPDVMVCISVTILSTFFTISEEHTMAEFIEKRNFLAEKLNMPTR